MLMIINLVAVFTLLLASICFGETAKEIMQKSLERDDGDTALALVQISSCRTVVSQEKIKCAEKPRTKILEEVRKDYGKSGKDTRQVIVIREPPSEKGIGFLQYDYCEEGKENDQWMYFSALGKVKRIISGNEDEPKTGSFFGTEMNYEDIEKRRVKDYKYSFMREELYQKRRCDVIESIPTPQRARKSNYSKIWDWIDKENHIRLKTILFDRKGRRIKQIIRLNIEKIDGIWSWRTQIINSLKTNRLSIFKILKLAYNLPIADDYLSQRSLTDASFREKHLRNLRKFIN